MNDYLGTEVESNEPDDNDSELEDQEWSDDDSACEKEDE